MSQLALVEAEAPAAPPAPSPAPLARRGPRECLSDLIACPVIEAELMEIFRLCSCGTCIGVGFGDSSVMMFWS